MKTKPVNSPVPKAAVAARPGGEPVAATPTAPRTNNPEMIGDKDAALEATKEQFVSSRCRRSTLQKRAELGLAAADEGDTSDAVIDALKAEHDKAAAAAEKRAEQVVNRPAQRLTLTRGLRPRAGLGGVSASYPTDWTDHGVDLRPRREGLPPQEPGLDGRRREARADDRGRVRRDRGGQGSHRPGDGDVGRACDAGSRPPPAPVRRRDVAGERCGRRRSRRSPWSTCSTASAAPPRSCVRRLSPA
jgi:hypothetical protein